MANGYEGGRFVNGAELRKAKGIRDVYILVRYLDRPEGREKERKRVRARNGQMIPKPASFKISQLISAGV